MREIIHLQVGQCGNQIGSAFWETIHNEHGLDSEGVFRGTNTIQQERLGAYFNEASSHKHIRRAVLVDLDPRTIDAIRSRPVGRHFRSDNFIAGEFSAGSNWAKGYYTDGAEIIDRVLEAVRREAERCEGLSGFQMAHSLGGGTGAGLGSLLLSKLREEFPDRMIATFSVLPSPSLSDIVVEPYSAVLSINQLIEHADVTYCFDNQAMYDICKGTLNLSAPSYGDINHLISTPMSGLTTSFRFPGQLNSDLRKLVIDMVPFPRLHFLTMGFAPLAGASRRFSGEITIPRLVQQLFDPKNTMSGGDIRSGRLLASSAIFRGEVCMKEAEEQIGTIQRKYPSCFVDGIQTAFCAVPQSGLKFSSTFVGNSTTIQEPFKRIRDQFNFMFRRKRYIFSYTMAVMDEMEFAEAESNMHDLIAEYQEYQETGVYNECY